MSTKPLPTDLPTHSFSSAGDFERFLDRAHSESPGIYLKLAKKSSGIPSVSRDEAVEVALCFGWIDGWGRSVDEQWSLTRYTPRRAKSLWSKRNVDTVARLAESGRLRPAGVAAVDAAKADGRWDRAYAGPATIEVPDDFAAALAEDPAAASFFASLNRMERYAVLWRVQTASPQNRAKVIARLVTGLADGKVPGRAEPTAKSKMKAGVKTSKERPATATAGTSAARKPAGSSRRPDVPRRAGLRPRS